MKGFSLKKGLVLTAALFFGFGLVACGGGGGGGNNNSTIIGTAKSSANSITNFYFSSKTAAVINESVSPATITVTMPYSSSATPFAGLIAYFDVDATATVAIGTTTQESGSTANDFSTSLTYTVTAEDSSMKDYVVTVVMLPEEKLMITEYFEGFSNNKYLEITNTGSTDIDLSSYTLTNVVHNGSNVAGTAITSKLTGTLSAGKSAVYANGSTAIATLSVLNALPVYSSGITNSWKSIGVLDTAGAVNLAAGYAIGDTSIVVDGFSDAANPIVVGRTFKIATETDTPIHTVTAVTLTSGLTTGLTFTPALVSAVADNAAVTFVDNTDIGFTTFNGNDPIRLKHSGILVDQIGPDDHTNFGADMVMIRKPGKTPTDTYSASDWKICPFGGTAQVAGDDFNAGSYAATATGSALKLFTVLGVRGTFSGTTVTVVLPAGTAVTALAPSFMTIADTVTVDSAEQTSGSTTVNFASAGGTEVFSPVHGTQYTKSYVVATSSTTATYTVNVIVTTPQAYTTTNYTFDGGLSAAYTACRAMTAGTAAFLLSDSTTSWVTTTSATTKDDGSGNQVPTYTNYTLSGIVTAKVSATQIYIQDQNAAVCLYKSSAFTSVNIGDKITVTGCEGGQNYYGLVEVSKFNTAGYTLTINSSSNAIYYTDSADWSSTYDLKTRCYYGAITTSGSTSTSPYAGVFTDASAVTQKFCSISSTYAAYFTTSVTSSASKYFFGVIHVSGTSSNTTGTPYMLLLTADQYRDSK